MGAEGGTTAAVLHVLEHEIERACAAPTRFIGRITACDATHLQLSEGRGRTVGIRIADLAPYLGGPGPAARILAEAAANGDFATISVRAGRITYDNDAQLERAERLALD
jgi:hypothetical protein